MMFAVKKFLAKINKSYPKTLKSSRVRFPNLTLLEQITEQVKNIRNKRGEFKRKVHYGCYLLGSQVGLRISEAVNFDLGLEHQQSEYKNLYLLRGKRNKER